jgi:transposase-like protein
MPTCPACKSSKVYEGYRRTSLIGRLLRVHEYLCEHCNLQFQAFSLRSPRAMKRRSRSSDEQFSNFIVKDINKHPSPPKQPTADQAAVSHTSAAGHPRAEVAPQPPARSDARAAADRPEQPGGSALNLSALQEKAQHRRSHRSRHVCPQCGATDTERRRRRLWERVAFYFTDVRAYACRICGSSFYARRKHKSEG